MDWKLKVLGGFALSSVVAFAFFLADDYVTCRQRVEQTISAKSLILLSAAVCKLTSKRLQTFLITNGRRRCQISRKTVPKFAPRYTLMARGVPGHSACAATVLRRGGSNSG